LRDVIAAHTRAVVPTKLDRHGAPHGPDLMVLSYVRGLPGEREANTETADATDEPATRRTALADTGALTRADASALSRPRSRALRHANAAVVRAQDRSDTPGLLAGRQFL
jgi:hypothetical protein